MVLNTANCFYRRLAKHWPMAKQVSALSITQLHLSYLDGRRHAFRSRLCLYPLLHDLPTSQFTGIGLTINSPELVRAAGRRQATILSYLDKDRAQWLYGGLYYFCNNCLTQPSWKSQTLSFQPQVRLSIRGPIGSSSVRAW